MIFKQNHKKGVLAKLLEKGIKILLKKECKNISNITIDIESSSIQIIKGIIKKINITAKDVNYKDLLFDEIELEANDMKIILKINNKELNLRNNCKIKFKVSLSENSLKTILFSHNWTWIGKLLAQGILNQNKLEDIKIRNNQILFKASKDNEIINEEENVDIKVEKDKIFLENKSYKSSVEIPIEDKILIKDVSIKNNLIIIHANSTLSI
ncbi:hypothetical protein [Prochlorococcus marinus]|uniref:DUF2993 domain-containing protein n=1 Tax=Prochlorococcus marinus XMU1408 TaxID=2213228 RepID=A0A318QZZ7_PROMR|nr:hypothetical protein [Prochlorococcus marinus]MBW3042269.1 hypothetical protein [Prochlorococcus marinus str. XMU1408]PYE01657.1 hypothetical protein DNJ73_06130 [Prochlorococcus marinus XMU1408]